MNPDGRSCRETNARGEMRMRVRHSKANAQDTKAPRPSTGWGFWETLFKEGTSETPQRTFKWKLGVEARFETGVTGVPSFSSSFSGNERRAGERKKAHPTDPTQIFEYLPRIGL